jgi:arabinogalactan endo-1,4-beta-galactosidase
MFFSAAITALLPPVALWTRCVATPAHRSVKRASPPSFYKGHDLPSLKLLYDGGYTYRDIARQNATRPLEDILGDGGMTAVRLRIWVNPSDGVYGLQYNLDMASWFSAKGYAIYLDFHFSDTWADPHKQYIPAAWPENDLTNLSTTLRSYVNTTAHSFADANIPLSIVALGNEIHNGMLWHLGQANPLIIDSASRIANFTQLATLWAAARLGITDAIQTGTTKPTVMIHIDNGWDLQLQQTGSQP